MANITVSVTDANNITVQLTPVASQTITIDRGVAGNGISSIVPVTISTLQYLRIYYTNGTQADVGPLTSTAYFGETPITIVGNTISLSTVPINKGGTNAITAAAAIQNLLPSYTGNGSKRLGLNSGATALEWVADGGGTVTSIDVSGGTTGLTTSGGPITGSGTITLAGTLAVLNGGTGVTTSTGTGSVVLSTSPSLVTPLLGTPTSGNFSTGTFTWPTFNQNTTGTAAGLSATLVIASGGTNGTATPTAGAVPYGTGTAYAFTAAGTAGQILQSNGASAPTWANLSSLGVSSFSAGTTGFTPSAATSGAVTLAGTLATTNGGTGLTSFTPNGVMFASSSSVLTTGSALVFDGTNLGVGITPTTKLHVSSASNTFATVESTNGAAYWQMIGNNATNASYNTLISKYGATTDWSISGGNGTSGTMVFSANGSEQMRLTSTGLGIGTSSPTAKLTVVGDTTNYGVLTRNPSGYGAFNFSSNTITGQVWSFIAQDNGANSDLLLYGGASAGTKLTIDSSGNVGIGTSSPQAILDVSRDAEVLIQARCTGATGAGFLRFKNGGGSYYMGPDSSTGNRGFATGGAAYGLVISAESAYPICFGTNNIERMRLDASGNLGLGVTPPTSTDAGNITIKGGSTLNFSTASANIASNATFNSGWKYIATAAAVKYTQSGAEHQWFNAASGTAGNAITFTQAMTLDASGNLGIGTTTPTSTYSARLASLAAAGTTALALDAPTGTNTSINWYYNGTAKWSTQVLTTGEYRWYDFVAGSTRMTIDASGNLGIGTSSPLAKLNVSGGTTIASLAEWNSKANTVFTLANAAVRLGVGYDANDQPLIQGFDSTNGARPIGLQVYGGNVGIGTSSPAYKLDVTGPGTANASTLRLNDSASSANSKHLLLQRSSSTATIGIAGALANDPLWLSRSGGYDVLIDSSGNLGVGTTSPSFRLHAVSSAAVVSRIGSSGGSGAFINFIDSGASPSVAPSVGAIGNSLVFMGDGSSSERARIDSSGRLIIGNTTMPVGYGTALNVYTTGVGARVYGTTESAGPFWVDKQTNTSSTSQVFIQFTINTQATGNGQINGNGASQVAFGSFSDRRLKENITDLPPQLANIMALRPVEFDYIESEGGGHQTSFIAQEFEEIYPDAIGERADGMKTLTGWGKTEARLVKAIQELKAEFDAYKASHP